MLAFAAPFAVMTLALAQQAAPVPATTPVPTPAPAAAPTLSSAAPVPAVTAEPEQVCRRQPIPGSRRTERVCHTQAEWDLIRENARNNRDTASNSQRNGG
ncbi:MAG: hypothetical protein EBR82_23955 [Caulobacteraceae bacterium]|nr:hypothetical protein [Caulobacteraceae bacterium]